MNDKRFEEDSIENQNINNFSQMNRWYEADSKRNVIIEWNKDGCNAEFKGLECIAEKLNCNQRQLENTENILKKFLE